MANKEAKGYYVLNEANLRLTKYVGHFSHTSNWMDKFAHYVKKIGGENLPGHKIDWSEASRMRDAGYHHVDAAREYVQKTVGADKLAQIANYYRKPIVLPHRRAAADLLRRVKKKSGIKEENLHELEIPPGLASVGVGLIDDVGVAAQTLYNGGNKKKKQQQPPQSGTPAAQPTRSIKYPVRAGSRPLHPTPPQQMEAVRHKKKVVEDPLNPHGSLGHQEKLLDKWRKHHKAAIYGTLAAGGTLIGLSSIYDTYHNEAGIATESVKHVIDYSKKLKKKAHHFHKKYGNDAHNFVDSAVRAMSEDNTTLGSIDGVSDKDEQKPSSKKSGKKSSSSSKMSIVYKKEGKKEDRKRDPEYEVPTKDLKKPLNNEPDSTTDDPETDDRRQDIDHHKPETSPDKLPVKHHAHFSSKDAHNGSDETSEPHHGQPSDKKKAKESPEDMPSKGGENRMDAESDQETDEKSDKPIDRGTRNGEDVRHLPPDHSVKKDPETGDPIVPEDGEAAIDKEASSSTTAPEESKGKSSKMSRSQKLKDIYKNAQSSDEEEKQPNEEDENGQEDQPGQAAKASQTGQLATDNNGNATDMSDGDESGHNEEDEAESTEDEPLGTPEKVNFRPTMDPITTQANGT